MQLIFDLFKYGGNIPFPSALYAFIYIFTNCIGILFMLMYFHQCDIDVTICYIPYTSPLVKRLREFS